MFLKWLKTPDLARERSEICLICSDVVLFLPPPLQLRGRRFDGETKALRWLEQSVQESPENSVARERRQQLQSFLTAVEQINRFRHDAVSKIELIRGLLARLQEKCSTDVQIEVQYGLEHVRSVLGFFRLTMQEKPSFRSVLSMQEWLQRFSAPDVRIQVVGTPCTVQIDEDYLFVIVQNFIQNAREAYGRNGIRLEPIILTDYEHLQ